MKQLFSRFCGNESGATGVEYGIVAAFVSLAIIAGVTLSGSETSQSFNNAAEGIRNAGQ